MKLNPADVLNPVFNALDALISNYGVYLYLVLVWLSLGVIAWVLGGGLRRKRPQGTSVTVVPGIIFTMRPPMHTPPPIVITDADPVQNDDDEIMDEPRSNFIPDNQTVPGTSAKTKTPTRLISPHKLHR